MYNRSMKQRALTAILLFCVALTVLLVRYAPAQGRLFDPGDPLGGHVLTGFYLPEHLGGLVVRRTLSDAALRLPLADGRGAQTVSILLRSGTRAPTLLRLSFGPSLVTSVPPALRSYHLFVPPQPGRHLDLALQAPPGSDGPLNLLVDQVALRSRPGPPPLADLLALAMIALTPALLLLLSARLPLDWAVLPGALVIGLLALLPAADRPTLLLFGPLAALVAGGVALLPLARAYPSIALLALGGTALRCYALGWGGLIFHPDERALVELRASGWLDSLLHLTARVAALLSGRTAWQEPWSIVLLGRFWAVLTGAALIVAVYGLGRQLLRPRWALLAAAYVTVTPLLVQQTHSATQSQLDALLVVLLLLCHTFAARGLGWGWLAVAGGLALLLAATHSEGWPLAVALLVGPLLAQPGLWQALRRGLVRHRPGWSSIVGYVLALAVVVGLTVWSVSALMPSALAPALAVGESSVDAVTRLPSVDEQVAPMGQQPAGSSGPGSRSGAIIASFAVLTWGLSPLLVQLGIVGWGAGVFASLRLRKQRWWPLLAGMAAYVALLALGVADTTVALLPGSRTTTASLRSLIPLVPLLCLTAALLLQLFARRLYQPIGRRTVRLLSGTTLCLALGLALGLSHIYRTPDTRVAASRWLLQHGLPQQVVLQDASLPEPLPLGLTHLFTSVALPYGAGDDPAARAAAVTALRRADYLVLAVDRGDIDLAGLAQSDPLAACYYGALFDGRLGFVPRASFIVTPQVAAWTIDDRRTDPRLRFYDHPPVRIFQRVASPTAAALERLLRCDASTR